MKIVILAAGIGSRLGNPFPKTLTPLSTGHPIIYHQVENLSRHFSKDDIMVVVGFKKDLIMERFPDLTYIYNPYFDTTNTAWSLVRALRKARNEHVLWLNGDVVFQPELIDSLLPGIERQESFLAVNTSSVSEEEVKYTLDDEGYIAKLSKTVDGGCGEAVGINFVSKADLDVLIQHLEDCDDQDYFERAIESATECGALKFAPVDISEFMCIEVDFLEDLERVNRELLHGNDG